MRWFPLVFLVGCDEIVGLQAWSGQPHPCFGNRTDALFVDGERIWVGCGTTAEGVGLFTSTGGDWEPVDGFQSFRVTHLGRGSDGVLYVAGIDRNGPDRVRTVEGETVFAAGNQVWNSYHAGTYLKLDNLEIVESLTGGGLAYRRDGEWMDGDGWPTDGDSYQISDADAFEGRVVGVGSTIIQPPSLFVETDDPGFAMESFALDSFEGGLWSVDADPAGILAGGVDQGENVGVVFWSDTPQGPWESLRVDSLMVDPTEPTWIRGVCRNGARLTAVGEQSALGIGVVFQSVDAGATWTNETPDNAPPLSQCVDTGSAVHVVGAMGWYGRQ